MSDEERLTKRDRKGRAYFDDDGSLIRGASGSFRQKKDMTARFIHQRLVALDKTIDRLAAVEDILGNEYDLDHLRELVQAEKAGRLVVPPCKVGDTVYLTYGDCVFEAEVTCIRPFVFKDKTEFRGNAAWRYEDPFYNDGRILEQDMFIVFGKTAFLIREEAEAALSGQGGNTDG